jgi:predicted small metal-binding protein
METKKDIELIDIVMNCEWDLDFRKHAAMEIMKRAGVTEPWQESHKITNP